MSLDALVESAATEIAGVIGSLLGSSGTAQRVDAVSAARWVAQLTMTGPVNGTMHVGLTAADSSALAKSIMALDEAPSDDSVRDTLLEVCGQAVGALSQSAAFTGLKLAQCVVVETVPPGPAVAFEVTAGDVFSGSLQIWPPVTAPSALARTPAVTVAPAELSLPANLDVILDIDLPLAVRFGETELTLAALTRLAPGSVIDLGRSPDDPVDVLINGRLIARAEVVVVAGNYGVRITEVISAADRLRSVAL
jgi:flagellar motor switch protein FliN